MNEIIYCCMDCGDKISKPTAIYGKGRCKPCSCIGKNNSFYGKKHSKKTINRL